MESSYKLGQLNITSNAVTTFEAWNKWKRSLSYFIDSKAIKDALQKKAILLHKGGPALQEIFASLEKVHEAEALAAKDQFAFALNILDTHFRPTVNRSYERYMFRLIRQDSDSIEQYVVRLRQQADNCNFTDVNQEIADQIIFGTSRPEFRTKILENRLESLDKIVELGKLLESVSLQSRQLAETDQGSSNVSSTDTVAKISSVVRPTKREPAYRGKPCSACRSRRHEVNSDDCPAKEGTCYRCDKRGHFANCCPKRRRPSSAERKNSSRNSSYRNSRPKEREGDTGKKDEVKLVKPGSAIDSSDDSDYAFAISQPVLPQQLRENRVRLTVGGVPISVYVDSGSSRAVFDAHTWSALRRSGVKFQNAEINRNLFPYGKARPLDVRRAVYLQFNSSSASVVVKAYILAESEGRCEAILGSRAAKQLGILRVGEKKSKKSCEDDAVRQIAVDCHRSKSSKTGKLRNFQLSLPQDPSVTPVAQGCRRIPFALRKPLLERTNALLKDDIIERVEGATPWVSNIVPVIKKNGDLRVCVDMRRANEAVLRERYPIPTFDEIISDLCDCEYFSKVDLNSAYHQIELAPESRSITTFVTPDGLFRFKRLFFGIRCAPEMFQRIMQDLLRDIKNVRVFFDDIIIFSKTYSDHKIHVQQVLECLEKNGLTINVEKSIFGVKEIEFLGHRISKNVVQPNESNIEAVKNFDPPNCKKDLQSFLGLINFVSRFIPHFSTVTAPLRVPLRKNAVFRWSPEQQSAFESLKQSVAQMKAAIFDPSAEIMLMTDASPVGLGAVLLQRKSAGKQPEIVAFASHSLTPAERNYSQIEREALGLVWGCEKFKMFLLGRKFELLTDHKPLEILFGPKSKPNARLERWVVRLQCFDYTIRHITGTTNIADPLSRLLQSKPGVKSCSKGVEHTVYHITELAVPKKFSLEEIRDKSAICTEIQAVLKAVRADTPLPSSFIRLKYELADSGGILLRGDRIVPPVSLRHAILRQAHEGHPGADVMKRRLRSKVWWPRMDMEADASVRKCLSCAIVGKADPPPTLEPYSIAISSLGVCSVGLSGPVTVRGTYSGRHRLF